MNILIIAALLAVVASLGSALFSMSSGPQNSKQTVNALTMRIGLSIALFIFLLVGRYFGWVTPHGM